MSHAFFRRLRIFLVGLLGYLLSATLLPRLDHLPADQNQMISVVLGIVVAVLIRQGT